MKLSERLPVAEAIVNYGKEVIVSGWVHRVRNLGAVIFVLLRDRSGIIQLVVNEDFRLPPESVVLVRGKVNKSERAPGGGEIMVEELEVLAEAAPNLPFPVNHYPDSPGIESILDNRMVSLRNPRILSIFKLQAGCVKAFGDFYRSRGFTEIKSSKIIGGGSEGGTNLFTLDYFGRKACLAQSPQLYKQTMVASGMERVFEIGHAYRAEKHDTPRHINEYVSLDVEMGFIDSEMPLIEIERDFFTYLFEFLRQENADDLAAWGADLPLPDVCSGIPVISHDEAKALVKRQGGGRMVDINPEAERVLCDWALGEYGIAMVFVNAFPRRKRPFYTYPVGQKTMSFDLLFRGLEITTGGRRINEYEMLRESLQTFGVDETGLGDYMEVFRYGCPPHGGFAIGLERLTQKILGLDNVKLATLFPRDRNRLSP